MAKAFVASGTPTAASPNDFKTFLLDVNVRINSKENYSCEEIKVDITKLDGSPLKKSNIELFKWHEVYADGRNISKKR